MKKIVSIVLLSSSLLIFNAAANFTGPSATGQASTVQQAMNTRVGSYITLTGHIVAHQRGDYFTFRDDSGTLRVEIEDSVWRGRNVGPETRVRLLGEVDNGPAGRYLWVKSLDVIN
ncbi:hypothetical protein Z042_03125 [Chania multitudinisentens RB-25]|uniref:Uncharacterized protein n=1 Tax=Chania multitudinisentens RB-25 TaxID=1441930 RepID=W0L4R4_9GAMM|nr:NirD/YgiW/YdeI family stress tolerance protein [Chania multitudinisentens]AHG18711.1 hypothetical protein Z042_03125 [Chania multitudinisentens RB-25]